jgi:hypothetical protein
MTDFKAPSEDFKPPSGWDHNSIDRILLEPQPDLEWPNLKPKLREQLDKFTYWVFDFLDCDLVTKKWSSGVRYKDIDPTQETSHGGVLIAVHKFYKLVIAELKEEKAIMELANKGKAEP